MTLIDIVNHVQKHAGDRFNIETYLNAEHFRKDSFYNCQYVLGNLFIKGYNNERQENFEIYKDHSGWQIWTWAFDSIKSENNQLNAPYYQYDEIRTFIKNYLQ